MGQESRYLADVLILDMFAKFTAKCEFDRTTFLHIMPILCYLNAHAL